MQYLKQITIFIFIGLLSSCKPAEKKQKQGIISLVPSLTDFAQLVYPDQLIGVSNNCDAPLVSQVPKVGDYAGLDYEKIIALNPKKILMLQGLSSPDQIKKLQELGFEIQFFNDQTIADVLNIPVLMDKNKGSKVKDSLQTVFENLKKQKVIGKPSYLILIANDPIQVFGNGNYQSELLDSLGFENAAKSLESPYPMLDNEYFITHLPQLLVSSKIANTKQFLAKKFPKQNWDKQLFLEIGENTMSRSSQNFLKVGVTFLDKWNKESNAKQ